MSPPRLLVGGPPVAAGYGLRWGPGLACAVVTWVLLLGAPTLLILLWRRASGRVALAGLLPLLLLLAGPPGRTHSREPFALDGYARGRLWGEAPRSPTTD